MSTLENFGQVISDYKTSIEVKRKNKDHLLSEHPRDFFSRQSGVFQGELLQFNIRLDNEVPNDSDLDKSREIRKERDTYYSKLKKYVEESIYL